MANPATSRWYHVSTNNELNCPPFLVMNLTDLNLKYSCVVSMVPSSFCSSFTVFSFTVIWKNLYSYRYILSLSPNLMHQSCGVILGFRFILVKLRHYGKAKKFEKNLPLVLTKQLFLLKNKWEGFQIFVAFSGKLNVTRYLYYLSFLILPMINGKVI